MVNPVGVFGPLLDQRMSTSVQIIAGLLHGHPSLLPRASFAVVDVRDVADLLLRAMTSPQAAGQRYLAAAGQPMTLPEIAAVLHDPPVPEPRGWPAGTSPTRSRHAARLMPSLPNWPACLVHRRR